jgi:hypothetical protein
MKACERKPLMPAVLGYRLAVVAKVFDREASLRGA